MSGYKILNIMSVTPIWFRDNHLPASPKAKLLSPVSSLPSELPSSPKAAAHWPPALDKAVPRCGFPTTPQLRNYIVVKVGRGSSCSAAVVPCKGPGFDSRHRMKEPLAKLERVFVADPLATLTWVGQGLVSFLAFDSSVNYLER
jgi:hypothetical protein